MNRACFESSALHVAPMSGGMLWLDRGTPDSLYDATTFEATIERRQGLMIVCAEQIARLKGWIDSAMVLPIAVRGRVRRHVERAVGQSGTQPCSHPCLHGFVAPAYASIVQYKCTTVHRPAAQFAVRWDDRALGIAWPTAMLLLYPRDRFASEFRQLSLPTSIAEVARGGHTARPR